MAHQLLGTLLEHLQVFRTELTNPGFSNMMVVFAGWVMTCGTHAVTQALVETGVAGVRHHEAFHRFFSRGTWNPDELGRRAFSLILRRVPANGPISVAVDDTLAPKKGRHVFGIGSHLDAVRSTKKYRVFCFGHCWVVLTIVVRLPFSKHPWSLPVLFRLYRTKESCAKSGYAYRKKTELAREMVEVFLGWVDGRRVELAGDSAYCNDTVMRGLPKNLILLGAMRPDAVLTALPDAGGGGNKGGRPRKRGASLPKPQDIAYDRRRPWQTCEAFIYGETKKLRYKEIFAQWYRACGTRLLRVVIVYVPHGTMDFRVFFSTDATMTVQHILEGYAGRWSIECTFRNLKQLFGFADSSARKKEAVERMAPFVGLSYTTLVCWFAEHAYNTTLATPPVRPWYSHKEGLSFEDVLRTARRVLQPLEVLDLGRSLDNLHNLPANDAARMHERLRCAA